MDYLCGKEQSSKRANRQDSRGQADCVWPNVAIAVLHGLLAAAGAKATLGIDSGRDQSRVRQAGYRGQIESKEEVGRWIGERSRRRIFQRVVSNGVSSIIEAILEEDRRR